MAERISQMVRSSWAKAGIDAMVRLDRSGSEKEGCVSLSGASVACPIKPEIGTMVILGRMRGRVVRHHAQGLALQFVELQNPDSLARTFG